MMLKRLALLGLVFGHTLHVSAALADPREEAKPAAANETIRSQAATAMRLMEANASRLQRMLIEARARSSEQKAARLEHETLCLDGALSHADAAVRAGREDQRLAVVALGAGDMSAARHQVALLMGQREVSRVAAHEADSCLFRDEPAIAPDQTTVCVVIDPRLPPD